MENTRRLPGWLLPLMVVGIALVAITFYATSVRAGIPDADDAAVITGNMTSLDTETTDASPGIGWVTVDGLEVWLHKSQQKDFVVNVSLQCGLFTETLVKSKGNKSDKTTARAGIDVRVRVTGGSLGSGEEFMTPNGNGGVTFCDRYQELEAEFAGYCAPGDVCEVADLDEETLRLLLSTLGTHSFNFILEDDVIQQGDYHLEVQARLRVENSEETGQGFARAFIGIGSAVIKEVRLIDAPTP